MTKKVDKEAEEKAAEEKINNPLRPENIDPNTPIDPSVVSHKWQPGSPAHDLSEPEVTSGAKSIVDDLKEVNEKAKEPKGGKISQEEYDRRTKLDVSDRDYINPSLDHFEVK